MHLEERRSQSLEIKNIVSSLVKAQAIMKPASFNKVNPHFKSRYADFASCMEVCRGPLSDNGIAVMQSCETINDKLYLITTLAHVSGEWIRSEFPIISTKMDSQGIGSAMTYAKRYSLCGLLAIVADEDADDDGESSVGRGKKKEKVIEEVDQTNEYLDKFLNLFDKEDKHAALEYLKTVKAHFNWSTIEAVKELLKDEKKLFEKFNSWKSKIKKTEES